MGGFALPREARLSGKRAFDAVAREGRRFADALLALRVRRNGLALTRFGLAVRRGEGGAVGRNRMKRRLREAFRLGRPALPAGLDMVCGPNGATDRTPLPDLMASLGRLAAKANRDPRLAAPAPRPPEPPRAPEPPR